MKRYVWYHGNCADGFGAAFAAWLRFGHEAIYTPVQYGQPMPKADGAAEGHEVQVFILDFSYERQALETLAGQVHRLVVLDHHASAERELTGLPYCHFDLGKSGAVLAWEFFWTGLPVPLFFQYLQDRDLWQWKLEHSREVSAAIASYQKDFQIWERISGITAPEIAAGHQDAIRELVWEGENCLRLTQQQVAKMAANHAWAMFNTSLARIQLFPSKENILEYPTHPSHGNRGHYYAPVANASLSQSEVCERLLESYPNALFSAAYFDGASGARHWSLRSRPGFDCSAIAQAFGGGGHPCAAGFNQRQEVTKVVP